MLDLTQFLAHYPWHPEHSTLGAPVDWLWHYQVALTPTALWPLLSDSSRMNRAVGYEEAFFEARNGTRYGWMQVGEQRLEWEEPLWDWNYAQFIACTRRYQRGAMHVLRAITHIAPLGTEGSEVWIYLGYIPVAEKVSGPLARYYEPRQAGYGAALQRMEQVFRQGLHPTQVYPSPPWQPSNAVQERLADICAQLQKVGQPAWLCERFVAHLLSSDESELVRIRLIPLAHAWGVPLEMLLIFCLHAVQVGLLTLSWDLICPHCRGVQGSCRTLGALPSQGYCEVCCIDFESAVAEAVEIIFHLHPAIRELPRRYYCLGEAYDKPHIRLQLTVQPGGERVVTTALPAGHYRARLHGVQHVYSLVVTEESPPSRLHWVAGEAPSQNHTPPSATLVLRNLTATPHCFVIEDLTWQQNALRPADLLNLQDFRDLFAQESLATNLYLDIGTQCIVFVDVVRSTQLYAREGDARAFFLMRQQVAFITEIARAHHGAVVKTLGDGTMMAFGHPADGVQAALALQSDAASTGDRPQFRVALHSGPCLAVNFNSGLDYFGQTVNIAAKLQGAAPPGGVIISSQVYRDPEVQRVLATRGLEPRPCIVEHPTLPGPLDAYVLERPFDTPQEGVWLLE